MSRNDIILSIIRVACVGDSITYGARIQRRSRNSYPAQLQRLLGKQYDVKNFGSGGCTLQKDADQPYWDDQNFARSAEFEPQFVLIMLGTNDTKAHNWQGMQRFIADYRELLRHYRSLPSKPTVYLVTPPRQFIVNGNRAVNFDMSDEIAEELAKVITRLAEQEGTPVIDIRAATSSHPECFAFDGVHPDAAGATVIARAACEAILRAATPAG